MKVERIAAFCDGNAGGDNLVLALKSRALLAGMRYGLEAGRRLAVKENLATFGLIWEETPTLFHARNPFLAGGVYEDPATGSAAAALGGYLRDLGWPWSTGHFSGRRYGNALAAAGGMDSGKGRERAGERGGTATELNGLEACFGWHQTGLAW